MTKKRPGKRQLGASERKGKLLESIVARMHSAPGIEVSTNVRLAPRGDDVPANQRPEIDVLLISQVAGYPVRIAIECKNYDEPVEKAEIDEFIGKLDDVGIPRQHGIFVSVGGYTQGAIRRARKEGIQTLRLKGLTPDRLESAVHKALQSRVYVLAVLTAICIETGVRTERSEQLLAFFNGQRQLVGFVPDLVWSRWLDGYPPSQLGKYEYDLEIPRSWYHLIDGKLVPVSRVWVTVDVRGLVADLSGTATQHALIDAAQDRATKVITEAVFEPGDARLPVTTLTSEVKLQELLGSRKDVLGVTIGRFRIPRIWRPPMFWPPSQRVIDKFNELAEAYAAGMVTDPAQVDLSGIEGDDLRAAWEPIWPEHPFLEGRIGLDALTRAIDLLADGPSKARAYTNRGNILVLQGKVVEAIDDYTQAIPLFPEGAERAMVCSKRAKARQAHGDTHLAIEDYGKAIPQFSDRFDRARAYTERGNLYAEIRDLESALADHNRALALDSRCAAAYINRGNVESDLDQAEDAIADYTHAIRILSDDATKAIAYSNRGAVYQAQGRLDKARSDYRRAIDLDHGCAKAFNNRGNLYLEKGDFRRAGRDYDRAIRLAPRYQVPYSNRGIMHAQQGDHQAAIGDYDMAIELAPGYAEANVQRGSAWLERNRQSLAIEDMSRAIDLFHDNADKAKAYNNRGLARASLGNYPEAVGDYTTALSLISDTQFTALLLYNKARACALMGEVEEACSCLQRAIALNPEWQQHARDQGGLP